MSSLKLGSSSLALVSSSTPIKALGATSPLSLPVVKAARELMGQFMFHSCRCCSSCVNIPPDVVCFWQQKKIRHDGSGWALERRALPTCVGCVSVLAQERVLEKLRRVQLCNLWVLCVVGCQELFSCCQGCLVVIEMLGLQAIYVQDLQP